MDSFMVRICLETSQNIFLITGQTYFLFFVYIIEIVYSYNYFNLDCSNKKIIKNIFQLINSYQFLTLSYK